MDVVKLRKVERDGRRGHDVVVDDAVIGFVYSRESSKTGFRRGYCVGQVSCKGWFYRRAILGGEFGTEVGAGDLWGPRFRTRAMAVGALIEDVNKAEVKK
jgi:hypothetical protein